MFRTRLIASASLTSLEASVQILQMPNVYYLKKQNKNRGHVGRSLSSGQQESSVDGCKKKKKTAAGVQTTTFKQGP